MLSTTVVVRDMVIKRETVFAVGEVRKAKVAEQFDQPDKLLHDLQGQALFYGRKTWADLDPLHYRVLLLQNLMLAADLTDEQAQNDDHPVVASLQFLLIAMTHLMERRSKMEIAHVTVTRYSDTEVVYDFTLAALPFTKKDIPTSPFRIVVDNTK